MTFSFSIIPTTPNLDPSFVYSFNHAAARGLTWGREFISTYGPYGYLISTVDIGNLVASRIVFALLLAVATGLAVAGYVRSVPCQGRTGGVVMIFVLVYSVSIQGPDYQWFALFLLFLTGFLARDRFGLVAYALAGLVAGVFMLIKLSLGQGAFVTLLAGCLALSRLRLAAFRLVVAIGTGLAGFLTSWIAVGGALSTVGTYVATGWEISNGYSSAMSLEPDHWWPSSGEDPAPVNVHRPVDGGAVFQRHQLGRQLRRPYSDSGGSLENPSPIPRGVTPGSSISHQLGTNASFRTVIFNSARRCAEYTRLVLNMMKPEPARLPYSSRLRVPIRLCSINCRLLGRSCSPPRTLGLAAASTTQSTRGSVSRSLGLRMSP
jgi:hypothetical protein